MGGAYRFKKCVKFQLENLMGRSCLGEINVEGGAILKWILKE
jgi:hypothetical protein